MIFAILAAIVGIGAVVALSVTAHRDEKTRRGAIIMKIRARRRI